MPARHGKYALEMMCTYIKYGILTKPYVIRPSQAWRRPGMGLPGWLTQQGGRLD